MTTNYPPDNRNTTGNTGSNLPPDGDAGWGCVWWWWIIAIIIILIIWWGGWGWGGYGGWWYRNRNVQPVPAGNGAAANLPPAENMNNSAIGPAPTNSGAENNGARNGAGPAAGTGAGAANTTGANAGNVDRNGAGNNAAQSGAAATTQPAAGSRAPNPGP